MSFYTDRVFPRLCDLAMRNRHLAPYRRRVIGAAEGRVLEIGSGSGLNLPLYGERVREVIALEPGARMIALARRKSPLGAAPVFPPSSLTFQLTGSNPVRRFRRLALRARVAELVDALVSGTSG